MNTTTPLQILISWANRQQHWVREIVSIVLDHRRSLTHAELSPIFDHFLVEADLSEGEVSAVPHLVPSASDSETAQRLELTALSQVENVNRLAPNQSIEFHPNMTLVYGDNASGKSGYVRILKHLAAVRSVEAVLPNIHETDKNKELNAKVDYKVAFAQKHFEWQGQKGVEPFDRISIFDTKSVTIHLSKNMQFEYLPRSLTVFQYVNEAVSHINDKLKDHLTNNTVTQPTIEHTFETDSDIAKLLVNIDHSTDIKKLISLSKFSQDEKDELKRQTKRIHAMKSPNASSQLEVAKNDETMYSLLLQSAKEISDFDWKKYASLTQRISTAQKDLETLAKTETQDSSTSDTVSEHWTHFIASGQAYLDALGRDDYPIAGDICIYCRQELGNDAFDLLVRYRDLLKHPIQGELTNAKTQLDALISTLTIVLPGSITDRVQTKIDASGQSANEDLQNSLTFAQSVEEILPKLKSGSQFSDTKLRCLARSIKRIARASRQNSKEDIESLQTAGSERESEIARLTSQLRPLQDRFALNSVVADVVRFVEYQQWVHRGQELRRKIPSIAAAVTNQSKRASKEYLNEPFQRSFNHECRFLRATKVSLAFQGRRGTAARRKSITNDHELDEVLSEGEQKVLALADFLAEIDTRQGSAPILFDDPVNSLDHRRIERIADRLYQLSMQHQVIVFTHHIWFASSLIARFEYDRTKRAIFRLSSDSQGTSGIVTTRSRDVADRRQDYTNQIESLIARSAKLSIEEREPIIANAYSFIRSWCEVVAEDELLCRVFRRHHPNAMMTRLVDIKTDKLPDAIRVFSDVHAKACRATEAHSSTLESYGLDVPPLEELKEDWQRIQNARRTYLKDD